MIPKLLGCGALGLVLSVTSAAVALANQGSPWRVASAILGVVTVTVPMGVGLYLWRLDPTNRIGRLLVVLGLAWFFVTLTASADPLLYSTGRVAVWLVEPALIYLTLAYPSGHLTQRSHRIIALAAWLIVLVGFLPTTLVEKHFPTQSIWGTCTTDCPRNVFAINGGVANSVATTVIPMGLEVVVIALFASVVAATWNRLRRGSPLMRRTLVPVLATLLLRYVAYVLYLVLRRSGVSPEVLVPVGFAIALTLPVSTLGFLVGQLSWRMHTARALEDLTTGLHDADPTDATLRRLLAEAVQDPSLQLCYAGDAEVPWRDGSGCPAQLPAPAAGRCVVELPDADNPTAALVLDGAFREQTHFVRAIGACAFAALDRRRLTAALQSTVDDLAASRARLVGAADSERRRIQRDLHDGLQQRLVTLRIGLGLAAESADGPGKETGPTFAELGTEVEAIIDELRMVTRTIFPSLLTDAGVAEALKAAALRAPLLVSVRAENLGRYPVEVESAVYFCCLEALQNALKHATGAQQVSIRIRDDGCLRFEVGDDGCGFDPAGVAHGAGLANMRDRIEVVGGRLSVHSAPGSGTTVTGAIPLTTGGEADHPD
jgi:signal transduction histidine kinase